MKFAIIDIETTGSKPGSGRITEVAIYLHDGEKIINEFCSLINPESFIPPFISRLTGISNEMVENAPKFHEIARQIVDITDGAVFVAHNAAFDYNFIRQEFKSLGFNFARDYFCTLQVSRKMLPGLPSYSLGKLCSSLNIEIENRHRAHGDALATVRLFELLCEKSSNENLITDFIKNDYLNLRFPPEFNRSIIDTLPENAGVYYLHDSKGNVIYIGKSNNIRKRILSHFNNKKSRRHIDMRNAISDISFEETGNELIALLLESEEIKKQKPFYNRTQKRVSQNYGIYLKQAEMDYQKLFLSKRNTTDEHLCAVNSYEHGLHVLEKLVQKFNLCAKYCGADDNVNACFGYTVKQCKGACLGKEDAELYNQRVVKAIKSLSYSEKNFMIVGEGRSSSEKSIVQVEKGKYKGYGFVETENANIDLENLKASIKFKNDNRDVNQIIQRFLKSSKKENIILY